MLAKHFDSAKVFMAKTGLTLKYWNESWAYWNGSSYQGVTEGFVEYRVLQFLRETAEEGTWDLSSLRGLVRHLRLLCHSLHESPPCWDDGDSMPKPRSLFAVKNGLLELCPAPRLIPSTPRFFGFTATDYDYSKAARCPLWQNFLGSLWRKDRGYQRLLQEWFGYCLLADTSQQKILAIYGPPCSGKSTIARILRGLIGRDNVACPSIRSLGSDFGLWALHKKLVAILPDATLPRPCPAVEECLKLVSGEDAIDIQRKGIASLSGMILPTRFVIVANEPPALLDRSGALARRLLILHTRTSHVGREDVRLTDRLLNELPGILNWSIEGWKRLQERGHFEEPLSGEAEAIVSAMPDRKRIRRVIVEY